MNIERHFFMNMVYLKIVLLLQDEVTVARMPKYLVLSLKIVLF